MATGITSSLQTPSHIPSISLFTSQNASFRLTNILFTAVPGDLICVIGPVGSGKVDSPLLHTLSISILTITRALFSKLSQVK